MSWIPDADGNLINFDHVREVYVGEAVQQEGEEPDPDVTHVVVAESIGGQQATLKTGDEMECLQFRDKLQSKLPIIRL